LVALPSQLPTAAFISSTWIPAPALASGSVANRQIFRPYNFL
jgi:hypothetical protein